jgi:hypothetical protein
MSGDPCLSEEDLCALAAEERPSDVQAAHLAACAACSEQLDRLRSEVTSIRKLYGGSPQRAAAEAPRRRPTFIGRYFIVGVLEEQPRLVAYRGLHGVLQVEVVVWRSRLGWAASREALELVLPGYRRLAELRHPGIAAVLDVEVDEGCPCLVTQYVAGRRLDEAMREGAMSPRTIAELMAAVAEALAEAHRQGIAHGALRMRSIVLDEQGGPHLVDLGVAGLAQLAGGPASPVAAEVSGAPGAPAAAGGPDDSDHHQQTLGEFEQVARQDAYQLAAILEELLAESARGGAPEGHSPQDVGRTTAAVVPRGLRAICRKGLAPDPTRRFADAGELAAALRRYLARGRRQIIVAGALSAAILAAWILWRLLH